MAQRNLYNVRYAFHFTPKVGLDGINSFVDALPKHGYSLLENTINRDNLEHAHSSPPVVLAQVVSLSLKKNLTTNNRALLLRKVVLLFGSLYFNPLIK
jgi:hypothetical protein